MIVKDLLLPLCLLFCVCFVVLSSFPFVIFLVWFILYLCFNCSLYVLCIYYTCFCSYHGIYIEYFTVIAVSFKLLTLVTGRFYPSHLPIHTLWNWRQILLLCFVSLNKFCGYSYSYCFCLLIYILVLELILSHYYRL